MKRNKFSLSHYRLFSCDMGELIPMGLVEVLPGDTIQHATSCLVRASPLLAPVMHPVDVRIHHWFVPHRLVWQSWEDFITGGPSGVSVPSFPVKDAQNVIVGGLSDYLGVPPLVTPGTPFMVSALPYRGYQLIWNKWYRDQDLETEKVVSLADGTDTTTSTTLNSCAWEKDYFTSARPWPQKGPTVTVPLSSAVMPVIGLATNVGAGKFDQTATGYKDSAGVTSPTGQWTKPIDANVIAADIVQVKMRGDNTSGFPSVHADTSSTGVNVSALRQAFSLMRFEEARARYGSRYVEYLRYLGVRSSDARLQRPEYLGGGRQTIQFSEVLQTAQDGTNPVGTLRGHGISAVRSNRYRRFFEEHGYIFTLLSIRPKSIYVHGIAKTWLRRAKEDFWQKEFENIGQQVIQNQEVYANQVGTGSGTWGYQDRYDEYRRSESGIAAEFRNTLDFWHLARTLGGATALNASFVSCTPPERIFAVPSTDNIYIMAKHSIQARRLVGRTGRSFVM